MITAYHPYSIARLPRIEFGSGAFDRTAEITARYGDRALLVTGAHSFPASENWQQLLQRFAELKIVYGHVRIDGEPSPDMIDQADELGAVDEREGRALALDDRHDGFGDEQE